MYTLPPEGELDLLAAGQTLVDFISVERTDWLRSAITFRRYLGGSPSNIAVDAAKLGGTSGVSKADIGAFVQFTDSKLQLEFHDLGAEVVIFTSGGGVVKVSDGSTVKQIGPLTRVEVKNVTGARNFFWAGLFIARLDGNGWPTCVQFAHEVGKLKLQVDGHIERMVDRRDIYGRPGAAIETAV
jgi:sugar/nucleoside kinase (ribokinase family)